MNRLTNGSRLTVIIIFLLVVIGTALKLLPGAPPILTTILMTATCIGAILFYRSQESHVAIGEYVIAAAGALTSVMIIANVYHFTTFSGGMDINPVLGNYDALRNWHGSCSVLDGRGMSEAESHGFYPYVYSVLFWFTGRSVTVASILSQIFILFSLVLTSKIAYNLTRDTKTALTAMILTAATCYWLHAGAIIVKDAWVIFSVALCGVALSKITLVSSHWLIAGVVMLIIGRPNYNLIILAGVLLLWFHYRADGSKRQFFIQSAALCVVALIFTSLINMSPDITYQIGADFSPKQDYSHSNQQALYNIVGDSDLTFWRRIMLMPLSCVVQFFIPFPWSFMRDTEFGFSYVYAHISYPWYFVGGLILYYLIFMFRNSTGRRIEFLIWGVIAWLVPCLTAGGAISRYALPSIALMAPFAAIALLTEYKTRRFRIFFIIFALLIALTLPVAYHLQMSAMQN